QTLASRFDQMVGDLGDHVHIGTGARENQRVDRFHVCIGEADKRLDARAAPFLSVLEWNNNAHDQAPAYLVRDNRGRPEIEQGTQATRQSLAGRIVKSGATS